MKNQIAISTRCIAVMFAAAAALHACGQDAVALRHPLVDGGPKSYTGAVSLEGEMVVVSTKDGRVAIPTTNVSVITTDSSAPVAAMTEDRAALESLRRASDAFARASDGVRRYEQFVRQFSGKPAAKAAEADLAVWRDRASRNLTRAGSRWLEADELAASRSVSTKLTEIAANMLALAQYDDAQRTLDDAAIAAGGVSELSDRAQFLIGVSSWNLGDYPRSRQAFEAVSKSRPDDPLVRHNLAVLMWRQNQLIAAATQLERALSNFPQGRVSAFQQALDNAAELLQLLETVEKQSSMRDAAIRRLRARFDALDARLSVQMATQGFARWGGTYIPIAKREELRAQADSARAVVSDINGRLVAAEKRLGEIDRRILDNNAEMNRLEARSYAVNSSGQQMRLALPPVYRELQADNARLDTERATVLADVLRFRQDIAVAAQQIPTATYSGKLTLFGLEAAPPPLPMIGTEGLGAASESDQSANTPPAAAAGTATPATTIPTTRPQE